MDCIFFFKNDLSLLLFIFNCCFLNMKIYLVLALLPLSLMACQTVQNVSDNVINQINTNAAKNLTEYNWTYQGSKASKPLVLSLAKIKKFQSKLAVIIKVVRGKLKATALLFRHLYRQ